MKCRVRFLVKQLLWTMIVFIIAKAGFMLYCHEATPVLTAADVKDVLLHGLMLDLSTALYFFIVPFLVSMVSLWFTAPKLWRSVLTVYDVMVAVAFALAFVADACLYPFWGFKLDASCLQYLSTPTEAMASVSRGYVFRAVIAVIVAALWVFQGYYFHVRRFADALRKDGVASVRRRLLLTLVFVLLMPLIVIGIRGGVSESTTNIGQVYYSQNQFLNHAAVNPVFSFLYSLSHMMGDTSQYEFMDDDECAALTADIYTTESVFADTLLTTQRPHIVIILLESCGEQFADAMPYLQQLKQEGVYFANCYANSWRTDRGTVCTLSGYPSFPSISVMKMPQKSATLPGLARTLQGLGYSTSYLYGGDINFTNMRSYLIATGWERLISMDDFTTAERSSAQWGVRDDITFGWLYDQISHLSPSSPSLFGYSTLSSHEPWDVPTHTLDDEAYNAFAYLDQCLKDFIEPLKQTAVWNDLLIVMLADHGINYGGVDLSTPLQKNHIPMLWTGGAVKAPRRVDVLCNQTDLCATLLGQLGLPHADFRFSRDVLSATYRHPTAVHNYYNAQLFIDSTGYILYDFDARRFTVSEASDADRLLRQSKAMLQITTNDLKQR